jgi:hypothetical protein
MTALCRLTLAALVLAASSPSAWAQSQASDLQQLHDSLRLTPAQEAGWRTFESGASSDAQDEARRRGAEQLMPTLTAPRRVDLSIAEMRADLESLERRGAVLKTFYATLTPQQQGVFDRQTAPRAQ